MRKTDDKIILQMLDEGKSQSDIARHFGVSRNAIHLRVKRLNALPKSFDKLTEKEKSFAIEKAKGAKNYHAALVSHDVTSMESAATTAKRLMQKPTVRVAIRDLMRQQNLTREYRIKKLKEHVDSKDGHLSLRALDQSWKLDGAYAEQEVESQLSYDVMSRNLKELFKEQQQLAKELGIEDPIEISISDIDDDELQELD